MYLRDHDRMPTVAAVMTPFPYFAQADDDLVRVRQLMDEHGVHHVPVKQDARLVGVISRRDVDRLVNPALPTAGWERIHAEQVMTRDPYVVGIDSPLADVLDVLVERSIGTALVAKEGRLAGILTLTDVCRVLAGLLRERYEGSEVA
ncbi:MAG: CBS domain-containing protein [bacterium]|nr:CBS domain-containing protein [bacterium]MCP5065196.1 CBS domain-containing protein [bacterium]